MFDAVRENKRIAQVILAFLMLPFAFFGVYQAQTSDVGAGAAAEVGGQKITLRQLEDAVRERKMLAQRQLGAAYQESNYNTAQFRASVLEELINQEAVTQGVRRANLVVSDAFLQQLIRDTPDFQTDGKFSVTRYENELLRRGDTKAAYEARLRNSVAQQMLIGPFAEAPVVSKEAARRLLVLREEVRTVSPWTFDAASFASQVKLDPKLVRQHYDENKDNYRSTEMAKVEYVILDPEVVTRQVKPSEEEIRKYYDGHLALYTDPEERRASHILIAADKGAKKEVREAARKKAEELLAKARAKPSDFARLAREHSQDTLTAGQGGDLDYVTRGAVVAPFAQALFALKPNQISDVVESEYGYHIILLTGVRGGKPRPFETVRASIAEELSRSVANKRYSEAAEQFGNLVYEQADTLKPVAEKLGLSIQQSGWLERGKPGEGVLANPRFLSALFSSESAKDRRNTEALDIGKGVLVSGRVVEYKPARQLSFEEVKDRIEKELVEREAKSLASQAGEDRLTALREGKPVTGAAWAKPLALKRESPELPPEARAPLFAVDAAKLPAYVGVQTGSGYTIYRVEKAELPQIADNDQRLVSARAQLQRIVGDQDVRSMVTGLRERLGVKISKTATSVPAEADGESEQQ